MWAELEKKPILADEPRGNKAPVVLAQGFEARRKHDVKAERGSVSRHFGTEFRDGGSLDFGAPRFRPETYPLWNAMVPPTGRVLFKGTLRDFPRLIQLDLRIAANPHGSSARIPSREESLLYCEAGPR